MATYGMKDAANLTLVDKKTGKVVLFVDYANATSSEWTAERVFATKKGTQAIAWDSNRTGTLTVDTEIFDLSYLALAIGSDVEKGANDIFKREPVTVDATREVKLPGLVIPETVSVIKLKEDMIEHDGTPLPATTGQRQLLPAMVSNIVASANASSVVLTFDAVPRALSYVIRRNGEIVGTVATNSFTDEGLAPVTNHQYTVTATNEYGTGALSAVVDVVTSAEGTSTRTPHQATSQAIEAAQANEGVLNETATNMVTFEFVNGTVRFSEKAMPGESYAIYYMETVENVRTITVSAEKFPGSYEIFADALIREQETGTDEFVQFHYKNARPQSNFTITQSATEPTSLSVVFDLFPDKNKRLAEFKYID